MIKILKDLKQFKKPILLIIIFTLLQTVSELFLPTLMSDIVDKGITNENIPYIINLGIVMFLVAGIGSLCAVSSSYYSAKTSSGLSMRLRQKIFSKVEYMSLKRFDEIGTASLITRTTNDVTQIQNVLVMMLRVMIRAPLMAVGAIIMAVYKNPGLSITLLFAVVCLAIVIAGIATKALPLSKSMQLKLDHLNLVLRERLTGMRVIRAFNNDAYEKNRFRKANTDLTQTSIRLNKIMALLMPLIMLIFNMTTIAIIWVGSFKINYGVLEVGDLMAFIQYAMQIMFSLLMLTMMFVMLPRASVSASRINEVLQKETEIKELNQPLNLDDNKGTLTFKDVSFKFDEAEDNAINKVSFETKPGEITAIIGGTGSGKSTLVNLIMRFYDTTKGSITIGDADIRQISQKALRNRIGYVPQKSILFTGTILENIKFGSADISDEEAIHAAEIAQASEFIDDMKDGYNSEIAQGGRNLSGGQKQRLSISRALAKKPEIYIFDDSFSALDFKTEAKLRHQLKEEVKDAAVLIVAQRVASVLNADQIIVLDKGSVAGIGTHKELLNTCEVYKQIVTSQLAEEEWA